MEGFESFEDCEVVFGVGVVIHDLYSIDGDGLPCRTDTQQFTVEFQELEIVGLDPVTCRFTVEFLGQELLALGSTLGAERPPGQSSRVVRDVAVDRLGLQQTVNRCFIESGETRQLRGLSKTAESKHM